MFDGKIKMVIFDLGGTICDGAVDLRDIYPEDDLKGVKAPVIAFHEIFQRRNINVPWKIIRKYMGLYKKDHLRLLLEEETVKQQFKHEYGRIWTEQDLTEMFREFNVVLEEVIVRPELARPVTGAKETIVKLKEKGIIVGCNTGYTNNATNMLIDVLANKYDLKFDVITNSEKVPKGRPAPWMIFNLMQQANVYPPMAVIKVDDTVQGIYEGRNAGTWTIGVYKTGNDSFEMLKNAVPDYLIPSVIDVPFIIKNKIQKMAIIDCV